MLYGLDGFTESAVHQKLESMKTVFRAAWDFLDIRATITRQANDNSLSLFASSNPRHIFQ